MEIDVKRFVVAITLAALMAWIDSAKMAGYAAGLVDRSTGRGHPYS